MRFSFHDFFFALIFRTFGRYNNALALASALEDGLGLWDFIFWKLLRICGRIYFNAYSEAQEERRKVLSKIHDKIQISFEQHKKHNIISKSELTLFLCIFLVCYFFFVLFLCFVDDDAQPPSLYYITISISSR